MEIPSATSEHSWLQALPPFAGLNPVLVTRIVWATAVLIMLLMGLATLLMVGAETGTHALLKGVIIAMIPVPLYVIVLLWIDRYEREPGALLGLTFLWGTTVAAFIAYLINTYFTLYAASIFGVDKSQLVTAVLAAPLSEELAKGLVLFIIYFWQRREFDGVIDGIVYAGMVGLGFAMFENFLYYAKAVGSSRIEETLILRGFLSPFSHPLFTSMTGIGLGLARWSHYRTLRMLYPTIGFILAITLHFVWNYSAATGSLPATYDHLMAPIFASLLGLVSFELRREGHILRRHLTPELTAGFFSVEEYEKLCSLRGRLQDSWNAFRVGGIRGWCDRARYHHLATELAFHRNRVARNLPLGQDIGRAFETHHLQALADLRPQGSGNT